MFTDSSLEQKETNPFLKPVDEQSKLGIAVVFTTNVIDPPAEDIKSFPGLSTQVYTLHLGGTTNSLTIKQLDEIGATIPSMLEGPKTIYTDSL